MRASAAFEAETARRGTTAVCNDALAIAERVAEIRASTQR